MSWKHEHSYNSPDNPEQIQRNVLWTKYFFKGLAEGMPNWVWLFLMQTFLKALEWYSKTHPEKIDNLNQAHSAGLHFSATIFGGEKGK